jgi:hypothetical protein
MAYVEYEASAQEISKARGRIEGMDLIENADAVIGFASAGVSVQIGAVVYMFHLEYDGASIEDYSALDQNSGVK